MGLAASLNNLLPPVAEPMRFRPVLVAPSVAFGTTHVTARGPGPDGTAAPSPARDLAPAASLRRRSALGDSAQTRAALSQNSGRVTHEDAPGKGTPPDIGREHREDSIGRQVLVPGPDHGLRKGPSAPGGGFERRKDLARRVAHPSRVRAHHVMLESQRDHRVVLETAPKRGAAGQELSLRSPRCARRARNGRAQAIALSPRTATLPLRAPMRRLFREGRPVPRRRGRSWGVKSNGFGPAIRARTEPFPDPAQLRYRLAVAELESGIAATPVFRRSGVFAGSSSPRVSRRAHASAAPATKAEPATACRSCRRASRRSHPRAASQDRGTGCVRSPRAPGSGPRGSGPFASGGGGGAARVRLG